jgi:hypothetical protein
MREDLQQEHAERTENEVLPALFPPVQILLLLLLFLLPPSVHAEVAPVTVRVPEARSWIGQRVPFFVELRSPGSFAGSASFDLPQLPGTLLMKIGNPVVGSQEIEGANWFVQTHEFALFSQRSGSLEVPAFTVRFSRRDGFTGPATDIKAESPGFKIEIRRPPGSETIGFLVTTESLDVTEAWEPTPGPADLGGVFKRTIVQRAPEVPGMALAPAPTSAPDGIRVYPGNAETNDKLERGDFLGERRETITYLLQQSGTLELPALNYVWWNPRTEILESKTLPAVTFEVAPKPATATTQEPAAARLAWLWLLGAVPFVGLLVWQRQRLAVWKARCWRMLNPPDRVAARRLIRACRAHNAAAANSAWTEWRNIQADSFQLTPELRVAVLEMQRFLFGPATTRSWSGKDLAHTFKNLVVTRRSPPAHDSSLALPYLNG